MPQILVDTQIDSALLEELAESTGLSVELAPGEFDTRRDLPEKLLREVRAVLCSFLPANHELMTSLELVQLCSSGYSQVENLGLAQRGVQVCNASGVNDVPIAEWAVMMIVALARDLPTLFRHQQQAMWDRSARFQEEVRGRTLGIWGYGGIGRETARLAAAMGLRVHVVTRSGRIAPDERFKEPGTGDEAGTIPERVFSTDEVERFCQTLDFLLLAIPQTPANEGLVDRHLFEALPDHAFLLNPARGKLVCEEDLLRALRTGQIAGAALDTHFHYPLPPDHPLWQMPNVILTPHIAGSWESPHFKQRLWQLFCANLQRWQAGQMLYNHLSRDNLEPRQSVATDQASRVLKTNT